MVHRMYHDVYWTKLPIVKASSNLALVLCFVLCSRHVLVWVLGSIAARMRFPTKCLKADCGEGIVKNDPDKRCLVCDYCYFA